MNDSTPCLLRLAPMKLVALSIIIAMTGSADDRPRPGWAVEGWADGIGVWRLRPLPLRQPWPLLSSVAQQLGLDQGVTPSRALPGAPSRRCYGTSFQEKEKCLSQGRQSRRQEAGLESVSRPGSGQDPRGFSTGAPRTAAPSLPGEFRPPVPAASCPLVPLRGHKCRS